MTQARTKNFTFAEYLAYDTGSDCHTELVKGEVVVMPVASPLHGEIIQQLFLILYQESQRLQYPMRIFTSGIGVRTGIRTVREPDLCVLHREDWTALRTQNPKSAIVERPPLWVAEVVSPGTENRERDYQQKHQEYETMGIPEYWIIDPDDQKITIFLLVARVYHKTEFQGQDILKSNAFPELTLRAEKLLHPWD